MGTPDLGRGATRPDPADTAVRLFTHPAPPIQLGKHLHDDEGRTSITKAEQLETKGHVVCFTLRARGRVSFTAILLSLQPA